MSYDIAIYSVREPATASQLAALYARGLAADGDAALSARPGVAAFYRALVARFPELDADPDASPFAARIDRSTKVLVAPMSFSRADEVLAFVEPLAHEHRLQGYDPQTRRAFGLGTSLAAPAPSAEDKLSPKEGQAAFVAAIAPRLAERGFLPAPKDKLAFLRTEGGVVHGVRLNLGMREVRSDVVFGSAEGLALAQRVRPKSVPARVRPLPSALLSSLHYAGWIPGRPFREDDDRDDRFEHEVCHGSCVAKSAAQFFTTWGAYLEPFFAVITTSDAVRELLARSQPFEAPRRNWSNGIIESLWNPGVGLIHGAATARALGARGDDAAARKKLAAWIEKKRFAIDPSELVWLDAIASADAEPKKPGPSAKPKKVKPRG